MNPAIKITRETEFYQGYIRLRVSVTNDSPYSVMDVTLDFIYDTDILQIEKHKPLSINVKQGKYILGNIDSGNHKSIVVDFDPQICSKGTYIDCDVTFKDYKGKRSMCQMEPMKISVICPILNTESDINIGILKELVEKLPSRDSRIYEVQNSFDTEKLVNLSKEILQKHSVKHVRTMHDLDGKKWEIWYYGKTKVDKHELVIKISITTAANSLELFAATRTSESLTGLLAEIGRELRDSIESKVSGRGRVINVIISKSKIDRSNLLDLCNIDGTCDVNVVLEKSEIDRSNLGSSKKHEKNLHGDDHTVDVGKLPQVQSPKKTKAEKPSDPHKSKIGKKALIFSVLIIIVLAGYGIGAQYREVDYTNSIGMEFMLIPAGEFVMGSSDTGLAHEVTIENAYYLGKYEVTQEQWISIMGDNPSHIKGDNNPVESVSWNDVQEFVKRLNAKEGTDKYRLPSEAEWEYACRAGTTTRYSFGDADSKLGEYAWYLDNSESTTHPVGQKKPNPWGLYDMYGNVWEWVQDRWHDSYESATTDGSAWEDGSSSFRVLRGGCWSVNAGYCQSAYRNSDDPDYFHNGLGFRFLMEV
ncbi:formylglycine-generating enzyme family protein [uncultured Methanomethylovorans sp.]|uniref:formylglycine-generating enzyme family protein n=1 Tax=uncultured Methanomethylovorans sp. TaxID=183759 RepID=UPI002AA6F146|nr:formylglycine-generating enzyme family protein [uncultured Methanomethylovorans sp.]